MYKCVCVCIPLSFPLPCVVFFRCAYEHVACSLDCIWIYYTWCGCNTVLYPFTTKSRRLFLLSARFLFFSLKFLKSYSRCIFILQKRKHIMNFTLTRRESWGMCGQESRWKEEEKEEKCYIYRKNKNGGMNSWFDEPPTAGRWVSCGPHTEEAISRRRSVSSSLYQE